MIHFYIFRHGETDWNRQRRFQGHTDIPLNESGHLQALDLASRLANIPLELILSSDLTRALQTAGAVNQMRNLPLHQTPSLRECMVGEVEGLKLDEVGVKYGQNAIDRWLSNHPDDHDFRFENGETKHEHRSRLLNFLREFSLANRSLKHVGISTLGGSMRRIIEQCEDRPAFPMTIQNCAAYKLIYHVDHDIWKFDSEI